MKKLFIPILLLILACTDDEDNPCVYEPTLTTEEVTDITESTATFNGVIKNTSENCETPNNIEQGFVYSTEPQPTLEDMKVNVNRTTISTAIENLEPDTSYYMRTFLTNSFGEFYGNEVSFTTNEPITVPDAPTITNVSAGDGQVVITFDAPANDGGSTITTYTATSSPGNITGSISQAGSGTITVTGLSNGTAYTFTVTATNGVGTSDASDTSNEVIPAGVPDAPTITSVSAGDGQVDIIFDAPTNDGNSTITTYTATSSPGNITGSISQAGSGTITVTGLSNGTAYTFTVTATNAVGTSSPSSASNSVTPSALQVGDFHDGGVVFYLAPTPTDLDGDGTLDQGLVCAVDDQSSNYAEWGCYANILEADGTAIGSGAANTTDILTDCSQSGIAAELCDNYTGGGYSDWFLPSKDELNEMYQNKATIDATAGANGGSGFASAYYWSSTENFSVDAWEQNFDTGFQYYGNKRSTGRVRAVRAF